MTAVEAMEILDEMQQDLHSQARIAILNQDMGLLEQIERKLAALDRALDALRRDPLP